MNDSMMSFKRNLFTKNHLTTFHKSETVCQMGLILKKYEEKLKLQGTVGFKIINK